MQRLQTDEARSEVSVTRCPARDQMTRVFGSQRRIRFTHGSMHQNSDSVTNSVCGPRHAGLRGLRPLHALARKQ